MANKKRISIFCILGLLVALLVACSVYVAYFALSKKALPGTTVGSVSVTGKNEAQIVQALEDAQANNQVTFTGEGITQTSASLQQIGYQVDANATAKSALAYNRQPLAYLTGLFTQHRVEPIYTIQSEQANQLSSQMSQTLTDAKPATEPQVQRVADSAEFEVVAGIDGYGVDTESLIAGAVTSMEKQASVTAEATTGAIAPLSTDQEAQQLADKAKALTELQIDLKVGEEIKNPDPVLVASWIIPGEVSADAQPSVDVEAVSQWINELKGDIEVEKVQGFRYRTESGEELKVSTQPKDGVKVSNQEEVAQAIASSLEADSTYSGTLETTTETAGWEEKVVANGAQNLVYWASPGEKWIDVNLSNYTVTAYEGATVVLGPYPSVIGTPQTPTVTGTFKIYQVNRSMTMRGTNVDGSRYETPDVPYAQFFHGGYALHGAYWRSSFGYGGSAGSHGCVNLPVSAAGELYDWGGIGTVVVSHY